MNGTTGNSARFAHYFAVCGLDCEQGLEPESAAGENLEQSPLHRSFKSNVLVHFPENSERCPFNKNAVNMLCFPRGLSFRSGAHRADSQFHSFTMVQDDGSRLYGFVLTFFEEVSSPAVLTAMTTLFQMHAAERQAGHAPSAPDSAASASDSSPSSSSMDSLLSSLDESDADSVGGASSPAVGPLSFDVVRDGLFVSKALCLLTPLPFLSAARHFLVQLHRGVASGSAPPLPVESYIHNVLYEVPLPPPGRTLRFHGLREPIICQRPASSELPVGEFPLEEVFTQLGVELMVKLMSCVLLETQVLLYSQDLQMLTSVAESLSSLLFPFQWQHIYLPITSAPVCHLLDAPVPFILGLQRREGGDRASLHLPHESNLCFVDIDHHRLELPEDLPCFPDQSELIQELSEVLLRFGLSPQGGAVSPPHRAPSPPHHAPPSPRLTRLLLKDLMEDRTNGNLDRDQIQVLEKLQASEGAKMAAAGAKTAARAEEDADVRAAMLNIQIREVFAARFSAMFGKYEQFVINGSFDLDSWIRDREGSCNFDKGSFLSVQPSSHLLFMSRFLETSMFSSFVDSKVISRWAEPEPLQQLFDARVQKQRSHEDEEEEEAQAGGGGRYRRCSSLSQSAQSVERRLKKVDHTAIHPHLLNMKIGQGRHEPGRFPKLQSDVLQQGLNTRRCGVTASRKTDFRRSCEISGPELDQSQKHIFLRKNLAHSKLLDLSPRSIAQTHREFVDGLLNECRLKTKRLLMERMGKESLELGQGEANITGLQEDTLILGLCDLIERTWGHGLHIKQGRSALWSHLLHYQASQRRSEADPAGSEQRVFADLPLHLRSSVLQDMSFIQTMGEGLSEVGQARAWIHLALEKKILSQHLKELLSNQELLRQLYKAHAFLLCEEEREQFLFHLLSLNTLDFLCFTRVFTSISIPYRVAIIPMKKLSIAMATVNPWVCVSGELGDSGLRQFPKNNQEITFQCKNLGRLSTLQLGQDSSGLLAKCLIDCVMVYNEITGHTYRFPCGRWLGKGVGDGSLERVLIAQLVSPAAEEDSGRFSGSPSPSGRWSGTPPPPELCSPSQSVMNVLGQLGSQKRVQAVEVQEDLREAANNLVKFFHKPEQERGNLTALLCGDGGLVRALEKFLLHGLKNSRLFQRNVFVWDFIEKAVVSMETGDGAGSPGVRGQPWESLSHYVNAINASQRNIGKEGKFQLFVCLGTRDQLLALWLPLLADCPLTARTYDDSALLRDSSAVQALNRILHTIYGFRISLEASLVKGIQL